MNNLIIMIRVSEIIKKGITDCLSWPSYKITPCICPWVYLKISNMYKTSRPNSKTKTTKAWIRIYLFNEVKLYANIPSILYILKSERLTLREEMLLYWF